MKASSQNLSDRNLGVFQKGYSCTTVYVGNLSYSKNEDQIKSMFSRFGKVTFVKLVVDKKTHRRKGIAFVQMPNKTQAVLAIQKLNGSNVDGRCLKVSIADESGGPTGKGRNNRSKVVAKPIKR